MIAGDILGERARVLPEKCALVYVPTGERFSYAQLNRLAEQMARIWTTQLGLRKGERIGILAQNSPEYVCAFFAAGKSGIVLVPLNSRQTAHEVSFVVQDAGLSALLYETQFTATVRELSASRPQMKLLSLDGAAWQAAIAVTASRASGAGFQTASTAPEDLYCLLYTSGSTGRPKGVMIPHRMVLWNAYNTAVSWQMRDSDVIPIVTPLHHAGGLTVFLTSAMLLGATIVLHRGFDPAEIWRTIERERATLLMGVPTIFKMLMDAPEFSTADVSSVRWFVSGGAPLPLYLIEAYLARDIVLKQGYGLTEVGVNCFVMSEQDARRKPGSIGKPMMFTSAKLIDGEGREAEAGQPGELCLKGPHVSLGYWNNSEATAAALDAEGWFHTGDNVRVDEEGFFYIVGRTREMFISGGVNVHPAEIEAELLLHPQVEDAAVIGIAHEKWGEVGAAFVVLRSEAPHQEAQPSPTGGPHKPSVGLCGVVRAPSAEDLSAFLAHRLARYKLPHHYIFVTELPRSAFGKVLKPELHKLFAENKQSTTGA
jgi:fatty-acyl-CoA synthase